MNSRFQDYTFPPIRRNSTTTISQNNSFSLFNQQRSMSFSFADDTANQHHYLYLGTIMQEDEEEETEERTRSKSTAAIMDNTIWHPTKQDLNWNNNRLQNDRSDDEINNIRERMRRFSLAPPPTTNGL